VDCESLTITGIKGKSQSSRKEDFPWTTQKVYATRSGNCKYHIVWIPKCRKKAICEDLRKYLGEIFPDLAMQKECKAVEGHRMPDDVHILISIPPKYSVSQVVGFIKGKSAIQIGRNCSRTKNEFCWAAFLGKRVLCIINWLRSVRCSVFAGSELYISHVSFPARPPRREVGERGRKETTIAGFIDIPDYLLCNGTVTVAPPAA
jgi:REP element-mobilizing transposase RayT